MARPVDPREAARSGAPPLTGVPGMVGRGPGLVDPGPEWGQGCAAPRCAPETSASPRLGPGPTSAGNGGGSLSCLGLSWWTPVWGCPGLT